jgi:hypothetical protein
MRAGRNKNATWRGGRAAEGARLESVYAGNCIAGSNPAPSAKSDIKSLFCKGLCVINWRVSKTERKPRRHVIGRRGTIETRWSRAEARIYFSRAFPLSTAREPRARPAREFACAPRRPPQCATSRLRVPRCDKRHSARVNEPVTRGGWKFGEPPCSRRFHARPPKPWFKPLSL